MPDVEPVPAPATPSYPPPPAFAGLVWEDRGMRDTYRGTRRLHRSPSTGEFQFTWDYVRKLLGAVGFAVELDADGNVDRVLHWGNGDDIRAAVAAALAQRDYDARQDYYAHRDAEAEAARRIGRARLDLADVMQTIGWAMTPSTFTKAKALSERAPWRERELKYVQALVHRTRASVERARSGLDADAAAVVQDDLAKCEDGDVRFAVLAGCRYLSDRDDDHATAQNGMGWSQSTSRPGHLLARERYLDASHAVVGLKLLRRHRRQLPEDLRAILGLCA